MSPELGDPAYLNDMLEAERAVVRFVAGKSFDAYAEDEVLTAAVERKIEIIGEAARRVSEAFKAVHPEIPWRPIMGQRHVLAHDYGEIQPERIWRVATLHIPELIAQLETLVPQPPSD